MLFIAAVLAFAATKPKTFHLRRSITIKAPPDRVFVLINDLHKWNDWSEDSNDPNIQRTFGGAAAGEGAVSEWRGTGKTGTGRLLITESIPNQKISITVDFVQLLRPGTLMSSRSNRRETQPMLRGISPGRMFTSCKS